MRVRPLEFIRRFARAESGASAVEFALVVIPFIALILACLQTALIFFLGQSLQAATVSSARFLATGQGAAANTNQAGFKTAVCNHLPSVFDCTKLMVDVQSAPSQSGKAGTGFSNISTAPITVTYDTHGNVTNAFGYNAGNASDILIVRVMYNWPTFASGLGLGLSNQPGDNFLMIGTVVMKNEPFA